MRPQSTSLIESSVVLVLGAISVTLLLRGGRRLQGTTLVGPWLWGLVAVLMLTAVDLVISLSPFAGERWSSTLWRYAANASTLCPVVALLGARRPQHAAWQFVVATLYLILLVPAVQGVSPGGGVPAIETPWSWLILGLVGMGLVSGLPTRFWPSTVALGLAQLVLLAPYLFGATRLAEWPSSSPRSLCGLGLIALALYLARWRTAVVPAAERRHGVGPLDRVWLDFRDSFGTLWALRIQQRINASAAIYDWPLILRWDGFHSRLGPQGSSSLAPEVARSVEHSLRSLLWRFVSEEWIRLRLADDGGPASR